MPRCPHCDQKSISPFKKAILSPGLLATCQSCGKFSTIRYPAWLKAMIPGTLLMIVALFVDSKTVEWSLNIAGIFLVILIPYFLTPLHKEEA